MVRPHTTEKVSLGLREHTLLVLQSVAIDHHVVPRGIQDPRRFCQCAAELLRRVRGVEERVGRRPRDDVFGKAKHGRCAARGNGTGLDRDGAVASDLQTYVSVRCAGYHVQLHPCRWQEVAALDVAVKAGGECDGCRALRGKGDAFVWLRVYGVGGSAPEDGECLGVGAAVGDVDAGAFALVGCGSGLEEKLQGARDPGAGILDWGGRREDWWDGGGESKGEGEDGFQRTRRFERHSEGRAWTNEAPKKERKVKKSDWTMRQQIYREPGNEKQTQVLMDLNEREPWGGKRLAEVRSCLTNGQASHSR